MKGSRQGPHWVGRLLVVVLVEGAEGFPAQLQVSHGVLGAEC